MVEYRSASQLKQGQDCLYAYYLARIKKVWQRPAAWSAQGTAVHLAIEMYHRHFLSLDEMKEVFSDAYDKAISFELEQVTAKHWFKSGPYNAYEDIPRRYEIGLEQVERYYLWHEANPDETWVTPDGKLALELEFSIHIGETEIKGVIDRVIETNDGLVAVDFKTGNPPKDSLQLMIYAEALCQMQDSREVIGGEYVIVGKKNQKLKTQGFFLDDQKENRRYLDMQFSQLEEDITEGLFPASPEKSKCMFCSVRTSCGYTAF